MKAVWDKQIIGIDPWNLLGLVLVTGMIMVVPFDVWAADNPFKTLCDRVDTAWNTGRKIVYIMGGIGALSLGVLAFFGRFQWSRFFALLGGLFIIAIFDQILSFTGTDGGFTSSGQLGCSG